MAESISNGSENEEVTDQFSLFELRKASAHRQSPSRSLEALVGEHVQRQTQLTPESAPPYSLLHRRNLTSVCSKVCSLLHSRF